MKVLCFMFRGQKYRVNELGFIKANGLSNYFNKWIFLGGTKHHWSRHIDIRTSEAFKNPELLNGCLGWDRDHGTIRQWGGQYNGKLPRISNAYVENE